MSTEELQLIAWFQGQAQTASGVRVGPGDDMAVVDPGDGPILVASDLVVSGTHFDPRTAALRDVGHKAIAACLSDCAAMAVRPRFATVSLVLPRGRVFECGKAILEGVLDTARRHDCAVVGGDTTAADTVAVDVHITATPWPGIEPVRRDGGRDGDLLCITGRLGGSIGGHHLRFEPRIAEARELANTCGADLHGLIDISDGLALDTHRLASASGVGAVLDEAALLDIASAAAREMADDRQAVLDRVLGDGEDYELLAAIAPRAESRRAALSFDCPVIGQLCDSGLWLQGIDGKRRALEAKGFVHE